VASFGALFQEPLKQLGIAADFLKAGEFTY